MKSILDKTIKPFLIIAGLCTALSGMTAFFPQFTVENILKLPFVENYTIIVQHWGMMILLVGIFMIISAFRVKWRMPVLIYSAIEKTFLIFLYLLNISHPFSTGFYGGCRRGCNYRHILAIIFLVGRIRIGLDFFIPNFKS
ncbi:MAG: hypothetical protein MZV70_47475 [Desulfobacterales bacterium]|nr:hypothetical protein [Desulfobacterales bacterium]